MSVVLSIALVLTPAPLTAPKETPHWPISPAIATTAAATQTTSPWPPEILDVAESLYAPTESSVQAVELKPPEPPPPELTPIEAGMNRLTELGASPWQLRTFGCLAWYESKNDPWAVSATNDRGLWQIHFPLHAWRFGGRDWRDPIVNAEVAWDIFRESGWRAWTTARSCGV